MKRQGRFARTEILEAEKRFNSDQSLYKMGREMKRSQASIRSHLINLGLMEYEPEPVYENTYRSYVSSPIGDVRDFLILSFLFIILPSLGTYYVAYMIFKMTFL